MGVFPADRPELGRFGESVAAMFLQARGCVIVARNVETADGEIDLIARVDGELTAVEVRTARRDDEWPYLMSVDKERQVRRVAAGLDPPVFRVDLVTVLVGVSGVRVRWSRRL